MKKRFIAFCLIVISLSISSAQTRKITISGFVHDKETGETLIGAGIAADGTNGTVTPDHWELLHGLHAYSLECVWPATWATRG